MSSTFLGLRHRGSRRRPACRRRKRRTGGRRRVRRPTPRRPRRTSPRTSRRTSRRTSSFHTQRLHHRSHARHGSSSSTHSFTAFYLVLPKVRTGFCRTRWLRRRLPPPRSTREPANHRLQPDPLATLDHFRGVVCHYNTTWGKTEKKCSKQTKKKQPNQKEIDVFCNHFPESHENEKQKQKRPSCGRFLLSTYMNMYRADDGSTER